eukprot:CAMPEP_0203835220 /NCGR_PEP_ID=MMETSP0115-20131106/73549_1 /ASSEMBLY_ACC=CAM_ASM_000227 /TAXON_ID=33651 /ORGANISM="Bicosoecid sp, Strain ms1" /LENGTH=1228 /DNA_ID=CAMNT_0050744297 /DNA_START=104 /DNA_END=3787 /DNA_ORIENTATION=-
MGAEGSKMGATGAHSKLKSAAAVARRSSGVANGGAGGGSVKAPAGEKRVRKKKRVDVGGAVGKARARREARRANRFDAGGHSKSARHLALRSGSRTTSMMSTSHSSLSGRSSETPPTPKPKLTKAQAERARKELAERAQGWFSVWSIDFVRRAYDRVNEKGVTELSRRAFWEAFTFYDAVANGEFLSLPQEAFTVFQDEPDSSEVHVHEVLLALSLFSRGEPAAQLRLCFDIFDDDGNGSMDQAEMTQFFRTLCRMCVKVGILVAMPSESKLVRASQDAMAHADLDGGGDIEVEEWIFWARTNVLSKRILNSFNNASKKSRTAHAAAKKGGVVSLVAAPGEAGVSLDVSSAVQTRVVSANNVYVACQDVIKLLKSKPEFSLSNLAKLQREFKAKAGSFGTLTRAQFQELMVSKFPELEHGDYMPKLFLAFDENNSGDIDPKEFALGLAKLMAGGIGQKLDLLFAVLDNDGDGDVSIEELNGFVNRTRRDAQDVTSFAQSLVGALDKDGDGSISQKEFSDALGSQPVLYSTFTGNTVSGLGKLKAALAKKNVALDFKTIKSAWEKRQARFAKTGEKEMNLGQFRVFMVEEIGVPHSMVSFCNQMFKVVDLDKSGTVSLQELFRVLAQITSTSLAERAQFYFTLYDLDGSGELSREEIQSMLMSAQEATEDTAVQTSSLLSKLDINGDGSVTQEEFFAAAKKEPALLEMFGKLFGVEDVVVDDGSAPDAVGADGADDLADMLVERSAATDVKVDHGKEKAVSRAQRRLNRLASKKAMDSKLTKQLKKQDAGTISRVLDQLRAKENTALAARPKLAELATLAKSKLGGSGLGAAVGGGARPGEGFASLARTAVARAADASSTDLPSPRGSATGVSESFSSAPSVAPAAPARTAPDDSAPSLASVSLAVHAATRAYGMVLSKQMAEQRKELGTMVKSMQVSEHERGKTKGLPKLGGGGGYQPNGSFRTAPRSPTARHGASPMARTSSPTARSPAAARDSTTLSTGLESIGSPEDEHMDSTFRLDDGDFDSKASDEHAGFDTGTATAAAAIALARRSRPAARRRSKTPPEEDSNDARRVASGAVRAVASHGPQEHGGLDVCPRVKSDPSDKAAQAGACAAAMENQEPRVAPLNGRADQAHSLRRAEIAPTYSVRDMRMEVEEAKRLSSAPVFAHLDEEHVALRKHAGRTAAVVARAVDSDDEEYSSDEGEGGVAEDVDEYDDEEEEEGHFAWV